MGSQYRFRSRHMEEQENQFITIVLLLKVFPPLLIHLLLGSLLEAYPPKLSQKYEIKMI